MLLVDVQTTTTPVWVTLAVALLVLIGTLAGAAVAGWASIWNGNKQRDHDGEQRALDRAQADKVSADQRNHELRLRQAGDQQRVREQRATTLRSALAEVVQVLLELGAIVHDLQFTVRKPEVRQELDGRRVAILERYGAVRTDLILDRGADDLARRISEIDRDFAIYYLLLQDHETMLAALSSEVPVHGEQMQAHQRKMQSAVMDAISRAQNLAAEIIGVDVPTQGPLAAAD